MGTKIETLAEVREAARRGVERFSGWLADCLEDCPAGELDGRVRECSDAYAGFVVRETDAKGGDKADIARFFASLLAEAVLDGKGGER